MAISLSNLKSSKSNKPPICLFYAGDGDCKTSLASEFPSPIYLRTDGEEPPSDVPEMPTADITCWDDIESVIGQLLEEEHEFKTVIVDTIDGIAPFVEAVTAQRIGAASVNDNSKGSPAAFGNGYKESEVEWGHFMAGCEALSRAGMNVVLLGHREIRNFKSPTTDPYDMYDVALNKRAAPVVRARCDVVAFMNRRVTLKEKEVSRNSKVTHAEGGKEIQILTVGGAGFHAKNRFGMPDAVTYRRGHGYSELAKYFPGGEKHNPTGANDNAQRETP